MDKTRYFIILFVSFRQDDELINLALFMYCELLRENLQKDNESLGIQTHTLSCQNKTKLS